MSKPIYCDLDNVLIAAVEDPVTKEPVDMLIRPGVDAFLEKLSVYGELCLLTAAMHVWAKEALYRIGAASRLFKQVVAREDLIPIAKQLKVVEDSSGLSDQGREELFHLIQPILPPGVIFDDYPVGSDMYHLKGFATGIVYVNPSLWIQVEKFSPEQPDRGGLDKAYFEFKKRNAAWRARPVMGSKWSAIKIA